MGVTGPPHPKVTLLGGVQGQSVQANANGWARKVFFLLIFGDFGGSTPQEDCVWVSFQKVHQEQITAIFLQFFLFCIFFSA